MSKGSYRGVLTQKFYSLLLMQASMKLASSAMYSWFFFLPAFDCSLVRYSLYQVQNLRTMFRLDLHYYLLIGFVSGCVAAYCCITTSTLLLPERAAVNVLFFDILVLFWLMGLCAYSQMASIFFMYWLGFYMLFLLKMESVLVTPSSLYSFYDGVLLILGRRADVFLGFGTAGRLLVLRGFSITFISCLALPTDLVLPIIYFLDSILNT